MSHFKNTCWLVTIGSVVLGFTLTTTLLADTLRKVEVGELDDGNTPIWINVKAGDHVLVAFSDGVSKEVFPYRGLYFKEDSSKSSYRLLLRIFRPEASRDGKWGLLSGVGDGSRNAVAGGPVPHGLDSSPVDIRHLRVPVVLDKVEIHMFPFAHVGSALHSLFVAIGKDKESLMEAVKTKEALNFSWSDDFPEEKLP